MLGELLGTRYKVIEVLGAGGFGHTYIAEDTQRPGNPHCVLKHLTFDSPNTTVLEQVRRLFKSEAETLEKLGRHDQIPQLLAYFEENQEFYLVQEFVEGQPLSDEFARGYRFSESQLIAFLEDVLTILIFVHSQGVIHRDIKPENLIRRHQDGKFALIDFGAVKTISNTIAETTGETNLSVPIYTSGYGASEQCLGRPRFSSDIYSLGIVAIQLLTGLRPSQLPQDFNTSEIIWRDQVDISDDLANLLDKMICYHFIHRYQSASEVLQALRQIISGSPTLMTNLVTPSSRVGATIIPSANTQAQNSEPSPPKLGASKPNSRKILALAGSAIAALLVGTLLVRTFSQSPVRLIPADSPGRASDTSVDPQEVAVLAEILKERTSTGERILNKWEKNPRKQEGVEQFAAGNYADAVIDLEAAWQSDRSDPETLIYLNNARIGKAQSYEIAAAVPVGDDALRSVLEVLRGIAQVQDDVNRAGGIHGTPLKIKLVDDGNRRETARQLAKVLAGDPAVLGVIGHSISDTTIAAAEVYQANKLVMVAPISSAVQLSSMGNFIFRTMPSDKLTAKALVNYMLNHIKKRKVVVFYNSNSDYSNSLKTEFKNALFYNLGADLVEEFDLARPDFDAYESVNQSIEKGAEVIMLASDYSRSDKALQVALVNARRLNILSGESLFSPKLLKVVGNDAVGMVLAVPVNLTQSPFRQKFEALWGKTTPLTWRSVLGYDAAMVITSALRNDPTRTGIQRTLAQPSFSTVGATQTIRFLPSGDPNGEIYLMTVAPVTSGKKTVSYTFKPLFPKQNP